MGIVVPDIYMKFLNENKQRIFDDGILYDYEEIFDFFPSVNISDPIAIASVFIKSLPEDDRVKVLMKIKKAFVLDMPISELLKLANNLPCVITDKYSRAQADGRIRDNDLQDWVSYK